jgi:hypothetical protein
MRFNLVHSNRGGANICKVNAEAVTRSIGYHPRMRGICLEGLTLTGGQRPIKLALTCVIDPKNVDPSEPLIAKADARSVDARVRPKRPFRWALASEPTLSVCRRLRE